jgi:hypothetical protein
VLRVLRGTSVDLVFVNLGRVVVVNEGFDYVTS